MPSRFISLWNTKRFLLTGKDIDTLWKIKIKELVGIRVVLDQYVPSCGNYVTYVPSWSP